MQFGEEEQRRRNLQSRDAWDAFASHRSILTDLIVAAVEQTRPNFTTDGPSVLVLGAGNCNDLDLPRILATTPSLHLVDLDAESLQDGAARQGCVGHERLRLHGGIDLAGLLGQVRSHDDWPFGEPPGPERLVDQVADYQPPLAAAIFAKSDASSIDPKSNSPAFDVVVSACLLSQILEPVLAAVTPRQPLHLPLVQAVRLRHLQLLVEWLKPGGVGILATDVVSSDTCPELAGTARERLRPLLQQLIAQHNFFTGLNPQVLDQLFRTGPRVAEKLARVDALAPWSWNLGPRVYAVCGWRFETTSCRTLR